MDLTSLSQKRVLVTGGTTGIGRATVARLSAEGARVVTFGRSETALAAMLAQLPEAEHVYGLVADATKPEDIARVYEKIDQALGGLDMLINNAGVGIDPVQDTSNADWRYGIETDFVAYLAFAQPAIQRMETAGGGHIVFIGSITAELKAAGTSTYAAAKAGVRTYAEILRKEVADHNIKVTWIEPGAVSTDMQKASPEEQRVKIAAEEMLSAEDLADAIAFVLTRPVRTDISALRIEPRLQKR